MGGTNRIDYPFYRSVRRLELQIHELLFNLVSFLIDNKVSVIKRCSKGRGRELLKFGV